MSLLHAQNLAHHYGAFTVFEGVTVSVPQEARIGLVGQNGVGKTTLLRLLASVETPAAGKVHVAQGVRIGYLRQEALQAFLERKTALYDEMLSLFDGVRAQEQRLRKLEQDMSNPNANLDAINTEYTALLEDFEQRGGYDYETLIEQTLGGLGFKANDYNTPLDQLSGGQKTRALLARLLLERPHLLILDEPTNHLDVSAIEWLEGTLARWKGSVVIVSHDRYFLDRTVETIWALQRTGLDVYRGNYSAYVHQRAEREANAMKRYGQEMERMWKEFDFIKRFIDHDKLRTQALGRLRRLSRDVVAIKELGLIAYLNTSQWSETGIGGVRPFTTNEIERELKGIKPPVPRPPQLILRVKDPARSGEFVVKGRNLTIGYPNKPLFTAPLFRLGRGDCVALIGDNGTGKTTFLKTVLGEIAPIAGKYDLGINVKVGYFSQMHDSLDGSRSVLETLMDNLNVGIAEARNRLAQYLFRGEDMFKRVGDLSGGERGRLALALLSMQGANFLVLDEPSNHLDIPAQETLQEVLAQFGGTILIVSHDRYLIDRLAEGIWHIENGTLTCFEGTYQEYLAEREARATALKAEKQAYAIARPAPVKTAKPNKALIHLEAQIHTLEGTLQELGTLITRAQSPEDIARLGEQYAAHEHQLNILFNEWAQLAE